jgi:hypothetical protein
VSLGSVSKEVEELWNLMETLTALEVCDAVVHTKSSLRAVSQAEQQSGYYLYLTNSGAFVH